ncbi:MAG TPA: AMP-binding protein [Streptosporangiaceae bacterium]|jgi:amino acid adenylation domain-containing protein|nr:AMP-binding protein [Streptosporangiaceae bacterium]
MHLLTLVHARAQANPDSVAIVAPDGTATYRQLMTRAVALASAYAALGVGPGDRVGVVFAPGREAISASLAALMCRAAYVPVDPAQPPQRAAGALRRCGARASVGAPAPGWEDAGLRSPGSLAGPWPDGASRTSLPGVPDHPGSDVAYVIHTSGSTGLPKGIEIEHDSVVNLLLDMEDRVPAPGRITGSWWCSPDFDVAVWESWSVLYRGGTLVVPPAADRAEPDRFAAFLDRSGVSSAYVPHGYLPALLSLFRSDPASCRELRRLVVGIEPIALGLLQDLMRERPDVTIINGYGPAEATVLSVLYLVPRTGGDPASRTPIGTAVRGNSLHLLGDDGQPTDADVGELVIAGANVARSYVTATPEQSARFTPRDGVRAYRTGDRVQRLPDGNLLFLGRIDFQMKVRGYRVEPGEVETALRSLGTVREVVAGQREVPGIGDAVVAYVVPVDRETFSPHRTRAALRGLLPAYALPSAFVVIDSVPITAKNGKVDRVALAALPLPATAAAEAATGPAASGPDGLPGLVRRTWAQELGTDIPADLGFVDLGGTSLPAIRVANALREASGRACTAVDVLTARSADGLAATLSTNAPAQAGDGPVAAGRRTGPLSPNQLGMWFSDQISDGKSAFALPHCFALSDGYRLDRLSSALTRAVAAHPAFTAATEQAGGQVRLVLGRHAIGLRVVDAPADRAEPGATDGRRTAIERELAEDFVLDGGPLMRCVLIRHPVRADLLLLSWHHLVTDGWSVRMFLADLERCYRDETYAPAAPTPTACDINAWLDERSRAPEVTRQIERTADDIAQLPDAASQRPGDDKPELRPLQLDPALVRRLLAAGRHQRLLPYSFLCTAYQHALQRVLDLGPFVLGCVVAGRDRPELRRVAGWYVNTELVRSAVTVAQVSLASVREVEFGLRQAHCEQGEIPIALLAQQLRARGRKAPEIIFSVDEEYALSLGGTRCEKIPLQSPRGILAANLVLLTGKDRIHGFFEHKLSFLSIDDAAAVVDAFTGTLTGLIAEAEADQAHDES